MPRSYYLTETTDTENMDMATVNKGDKFKVEFPVDKPGSILRCIRNLFRYVTWIRYNIL